MKCFYSHIDFLDSRTDTSSIGILEHTDSKIVKLILQTPVEPQFAGLLAAYGRSPEADGELLFQLRRFSFAEPLGMRYCYLAATLYAKQGDQYLELANLDTTLLASFSVRKNLQAETRNILYDFFASHIGSWAAGASFSMDELKQRDSLDKLQIPLYTTTTYVEGLYSSYAAFRDQHPDLHGEVKVNDSGKIVKIKVTDLDWKYMQRDHIYALVYKGVPYAVTYFGFWPLEKIGGDFFFTGKLKLDASDEERWGAYVMFGLGGIAGRNVLGDKYICRSMLDHQNGEFIHLKLLAVAY